MTDRTTCVIRVDGEDVSSAIMPRLLSLSITDKAGSSSDTVSIALDDTDGSIALPREGAKIEVDLGYQGSGGSVVFRGVVDEVRSSGSRSGRTLSVSGKGFDTQGKPKQPQRKHWDGAPLSTVFSDAAKGGGVPNVRVDESLGGLSRPYWAMQGESFIHFGERIAREVGGTFKVSGDTAILVKRGAGTSATGKALSVVRAVYGDNLLSWDIAPVLGRPRYSKAKARWYDKKTATWKTAEVDIKDNTATAEFSERFTSADEGEADSQSGSRKTESERGRGGGSITINGTAAAQPEGSVALSGARPGIDGTYRIDAVNQDFSRSSGWVTRIDLKEPQDEAGKDKRPSKSGKKGKGKAKADTPTRDLGEY